MFQKILTSCNFVQNKINYAVAFAFCMLTALGGSVFAAGEAQTIQVTSPNIDWNTTTQSLLTVFTGVVIAAAGLALSVWVLQMIVGLFKRSAH